MHAPAARTETLHAGRQRPHADLPAGPVPHQPSAHGPRSSLSVCVAGLGGLGATTLNARLAELLRRSHGEVCAIDQLGVARRRASVTNLLRAGRGVRCAGWCGSPYDVLIALEESESLRQLDRVGPQTLVLLADCRVETIAGYSGAPLPSHAVVRSTLDQHAGYVLQLPVTRELGRHQLNGAHGTALFFGAFAALLGLTVAEAEHHASTGHARGAATLLANTGHAAAVRAGLLGWLNGGHRQHAATPVVTPAVAA